MVDKVIPYFQRAILISQINDTVRMVDHYINYHMSAHSGDCSTAPYLSLVMPAVLFAH